MKTLTHIAQTLSSILALSLLATTAHAQRDNNPRTESVPRVLPYQGVLDQNGAPMNGPVSMRFMLFDRPEGGAPVWTETRYAADERAVQVQNGRFSVNLGAYTDLTRVVFDAEALYLATAIRPEGAASDIPLAGRQRINPAPYALWTTTAANLVVAGLLDAQSASVSGDITAGTDLRVDRTLTVNGQLQAGNRGFGRRFDQDRLRLGEGGWDTMVIEEGATLGANDHRPALDVRQNATFEDTLTLSDTATFNGPSILRNTQTFEGSTNVTGGTTFAAGLTAEGRLTVTSDATLAGSFNATSNMEVDGTLTVGGNVGLTDCRICVNFRNSNNNNNDRRHACVSLVSRNGSGWSTFRNDLNDNDEYNVVFLCDGRGNSAGDGNVLP